MSSYTLLYRATLHRKEVGGQGTNGISFEEASVTFSGRLLTPQMSARTMARNALSAMGNSVSRSSLPWFTPAVVAGPD